MKLYYSNHDCVAIDDYCFENMRKKLQQISVITTLIPGIVKYLLILFYIRFKNKF